MEASDHTFRPQPGSAQPPPPIASPQLEPGAQPHTGERPGPPHQPHVQRDPNLLKRAATPLFVAGAIALKFGAKLKVLLVLATKIKFLTTSATMLVSVAAYSLIWGWQFAAGFVLLILIHEMGHVIQLRREGIEASAPMFIPFLGAVIAAKSLGNNALAEARVGLAGPILGSLAAAALVPVALVTGNNLFMALAFTGFLLNLFNLLPVVPLDGGRAMAALTPVMWIVGFAGLVALTLVFPNPIMLIILLFGGMESWRRWKQRKDPEQAEYYKVPPRARAIVAVVYLGLIALLAFGMAETHLERSIS